MTKTAFTLRFCRF